MRLTQNKALRYSLLILLIFSPYLLNLVFYQINDDRLIELTADGTLYGQNSDYIIYTSVVVGVLLKFLNDLGINFNWFSFLLYSTQALAIVLLIRLVLNNANSSKFKYLIFSIPLFTFGIVFFSLQYTQTAIIAAGLGVLVVVNTKNRIDLILGLFSIFIGISWRPNAGLLGLVIVVLIIFLFKNDWLTIKRILYGFAVSLASFAFYSANFSTLSPWVSEEKKQFIEFNSAREAIQGFEPTADTQKKIRDLSKEIGWSGNDFALSQRKSYTSDSQVYLTSEMEYLAENRRGSDLFNFYKDVAIKLITEIKNNYLISFLVVLLIPVWLLLLTKNFSIRKAFGFYSVALGSFYLCLSLGKLPERLFWPIGLILLFSLIVLALLEEKRQFNPVKNKTTGIFTLLLTALILVNFFDQASIVRSEQWWKSALPDRSQGFERILSYESDKPIVAFSSFYSPVFKTSSPIDSKFVRPAIWNDLVIVGWVNRSPDYEDNLKRLGLSQDLFSSVAFGDAYLGVGSIEDLQMVDQFLREHRNIAVDWPEAPFVFNDSGLGIWKAEGYRYLD